MQEEMGRSGPPRNRSGNKNQPIVTDAPASARLLEPSPFSSTIPRVRQDLPVEPPGAKYDNDLELVCRLAATVGAESDQPAPLSYSALVIALLLADDPASSWFQALTARLGIDVDAIFASKNARRELSSEYKSAALDGALPNVTPLFSMSARRMLSSAHEVAKLVARRPLDPPLGTRHLLAAYAFRTPSDHRDQLRSWGYDEERWRDALLAEFRSMHPQELWSQLSGEVREEPVSTLIGRYTSDDPSTVADDLIGVDDDAGALARLVMSSEVRPPIAIGVFGQWGSGKTYFMRRIQKCIDGLPGKGPTTDATALFHQDVVQIRFDAWHYVETNLWASLVEYIFAALDRWLMAKSGQHRCDADRMFERLATAQQLKLDALEEVVARRAERNDAERRAERARREYQEALARSSVIKPRAFLSTLLRTILDDQPKIRDEIEKLGAALGIEHLSSAHSRISEVLTEAGTEVGRGRLIGRSLIARLGKKRWMLGLCSVLVLAPFALTAVKDWVAAVLPWLNGVSDNVTALTGFVIGAAALFGRMIKIASNGLTRLDTLRKQLDTEIEKQKKVAMESSAAGDAADAESDLKKRKQALDAAERSLADVQARLDTARQEFEGSSARGRLNAFIRAKATDGGYAKHLGIIAAIRRDFEQLASLMQESQQGDAESFERQQLAAEALTRVDHFMRWLERSQDTRLTATELRSLLALLEPATAAKRFDSWRPLLAEHFESPLEELAMIRDELAHSEQTPLPKFSRIILYIDDLDRCPPATVVDVLQAVHLLLSFPLFVVMVAVDARWVSNALTGQFASLLKEGYAEDAIPTADSSTRDERATSYDYMEKIFQIPYWVRPLDREAARSYVRRIALRDLEPASAPTAKLTGVAGNGAARDQRTDPATTQQQQRAAPAHDSHGMQHAESSVGSAPPISTMMLDPFEIQTLETFAEFVGTTPRRALRFVNTYRLIKTGMPQLLGKTNAAREPHAPPALLIAQLAIVIGAPVAASRYFHELDNSPPTRALDDVVRHLGESTELKSAMDSEVLIRCLNALRGEERTGAAARSRVRVSDLRVFAATARRYSFSTPP